MSILHERLLQKLAAQDPRLQIAKGPGGMAVSTNIPAVPDKGKTAVAGQNVTMAGATGNSLRASTDASGAEKTNVVKLPTSDKAFTEIKPTTASVPWKPA